METNQINHQLTSVSSKELPNRPRRVGGGGIPKGINNHTKMT